MIKRLLLVDGGEFSQHILGHTMALVLSVQLRIPAIYKEGSNYEENFHRVLQLSGNWAERADDRADDDQSVT